MDRRSFAFLVLSLVGSWNQSAFAQGSCNVTTGNGTFYGTCLDCNNVANTNFCRNSSYPAANGVCPWGYLCYVGQPSTPTPPVTQNRVCTARCRQYFPPYSTPGGSQLPAQTEYVNLSKDLSLYGGSEQAAYQAMQDICRDQGAYCGRYCDMQVVYTIVDFSCR